MCEHETREFTPEQKALLTRGRTWKPAGTERLKTPCYKVQTFTPCPGTAWVYFVPGGIAALKFNDDYLLTATSEGLIDLTPYKLIAKLQLFIRDCARKDLPQPEAIEKVRENFGEPDIVIPLEDVNVSGDAIRAAVEKARADRAAAMNTTK